MPKITLKQTLVLTLDSEDYNVTKYRGGTDCASCPLYQTTRTHTGSILKANHTKCYELFRKVFGAECIDVLIDPKKCQ